MDKACKQHPHTLNFPGGMAVTLCITNILDASVCIGNKYALSSPFLPPVIHPPIHYCLIGSIQRLPSRMHGGASGEQCVHLCLETTNHQETQPNVDLSSEAGPKPLRNPSCPRDVGGWSNSQPTITSSQTQLCPHFVFLPSSAFVAQVLLYQL